MTIGARVLKTGLAVAMAIFLSELLGFPSPIISAVAAIFTIQPSIYRSWKQMLDQLQANLIGAAIALIAVWLVGSTPIAVGLVCIVVILINIRLKMESTIGLTLVTVVAVMEAHGAGWLFAFERLAMVLAGMGAAFAVNVFLFPPRPRRQFADHIQLAFSQLSLLLRNAVSKEIKENVLRQEKERLRGLLGKLEERLKLFEEERAVLAKSKLNRARQLIVSKQIVKTLQVGADLLDVIEDHFYSTPGASEWALRFDQQIDELTRYHEQLILKWQDKIKIGAAGEPVERHDSRFVEQLEVYLSEEPAARVRLVFVGAGLLKYDYHLRRLEKLIEQVHRHSGDYQGAMSEMKDMLFK
ncbi:hypothetical protein EBB07_14055 [Paenibacillaceae bacterium]|nr:hypothetical protein EBB07_14055 [Paenibacillaceae bacterium]